MTGTFRIIVDQQVRYTFPIEADDAEQALTLATEQVRSGDWPDQDNEVLDDSITVAPQSWRVERTQVQYVDATSKNAAVELAYGEAQWEEIDMKVQVAL